MKHFFLLILAALLLCAAPAHAQTLKSLMFNSISGQVVANTGTNVLSFELGNGVVIGGDAGTKLTVNSESLSFYSSAQGVNVLRIPADDTVQLNGGRWNDPSVRASLGFSTNLSTLWTASNAATAARALSGSTNTNHPYSGTVALTNTNAVLTFSNGILQSVQ